MFNTPSHHRVHHGRNPIYIDRNHGGTLIIWDRLFEPFRKNRKRWSMASPHRCRPGILAGATGYMERYGHRHRPGQRHQTQTRYLFQAPGWMPEELGGPILPKRLIRSPIKNSMWRSSILACLCAGLLPADPGRCQLLFVFAGGIEYPAAVAGSCHGIMVHHSYGIDTGETAPRILAEGIRLLATPVVIWWCSGQMLAAGITTGIMLLSLLCWPVLFRDSRSN